MELLMRTTIRVSEQTCATMHDLACKVAPPISSPHSPRRTRIPHWAALIFLAAFLVGCAEASTSPAPLAYATVVGFADPLTGKYDTIITLYDRPVDSQVPINKVGSAHADEQVGVMEQRADGNVRIRTNVMQEGWTRIEALKDIKNTQ
jgi:hypothetical protein